MFAGEEEGNKGRKKEIKQGIKVWEQEGQKQMNKAELIY